ncbi:MAG TPA: phage virion morphogenesis protein [Candidatus Gastranaerophilales bacterium]|nr:phage virion morphogenesis protein [Candidatus Gastranaerophilales bacterium]
MSDFIEIRLDDKKLLRALNQLAEKTSDLRPLMKNIAEILADSTEENFEQQGRPKWEGLKKPTIEYRTKKKYWPGKILQMRGELASSITSSYDENSAIIGTNKVYAAIHQLGGPAGKNKSVDIPERPYLKIDDEENADILREIKNYLE